MSKFELKLPRMGESVAEATLTNWLKEVGETVELDEPIFEIATDKVDSEVPSEVEGVLVERRYEVDDIVKVGDIVAVIETEGEGEGSGSSKTADDSSETEKTTSDTSETTVKHGEAESENNIKPPKEEASRIEDASRVKGRAAEADNENGVKPPKEAATLIEDSFSVAKSTAASAEQGTGTSSQNSERFYSPLVKNIAQQENISVAELDTLTGTGKEGRVTKNDILDYVANGKGGSSPAVEPSKNGSSQNTSSKSELSQNASSQSASSQKTASQKTTAARISSDGHEVIEMTRMGKLIAKHMVESVSTSAHVQSFIEVDVTNIVNWRNRTKADFQKREGEKLTYTPIFMEAVAKALKKYPMMNVSVDGHSVIKKKNINIGMAAALPDGNLIVPVIKNADQLNLVGMAKVVNDLASRARDNRLKPDEVRGGTYTVTNVGTFGSVFGTPIINQPQVGVLALGAIRKVPAVIETADGDFIGIRSKMYLSHSYDHRVVNGALGSMFVKAVADYLEDWDVDRDI